jgi:peptidoglycan/xylan/chitin deacetylase (PgdA/CDA1 family)
MRCLYNHGVFDNDVENFQIVLDELMKCGVFVDSKHCEDIVTGRRELDGRYFHLSFDDGFKNNLTNVAPILSERQIPAIIFIATDYIGCSPAMNAQYCRDQLGLPAVAETLTWDDCRELINAGFEIGSHTKRHIVLAEVGEQALRSELLESRHEIEHQLGIACPYFAWPYGGVEHVQGVRPQVFEDAGYRAVFSASRGQVQPGKTDIFSIPRHQCEAAWPVRQSRLFAWGGRGED